MTVAHTVSSLAHDAARAASDLGRSAAELGSEAAHTIVSHVPGHHRKRHSMPWAWLIAAAALAAVAVMSFRRSRGAAYGRPDHSPMSTEFDDARQQPVAAGARS